MQISIIHQGFIVIHRGVAEHFMSHHEGPPALSPFIPPVRFVCRASWLADRAWP